MHTQASSGPAPRSPSQLTRFSSPGYCVPLDRWKPSFLRRFVLHYLFSITQGQLQSRLANVDPQGKREAIGARTSRCLFHAGKCRIYVLSKRDAYDAVRSQTHRKGRWELLCLTGSPVLVAVASSARAEGSNQGSHLPSERPRIVPDRIGKVPLLPGKINIPDSEFLNVAVLQPSEGPLRPRRVVAGHKVAPDDPDGRKENGKSGDPAYCGSH
jgi:hypothetical protein